MFKVTPLRGKVEMIARIRRLQAKFPDEVGRALYQEVSIEATEVKRRTPVDKGTLRSTVHVIGPFRTGIVNARIYCQIVCGGDTAPYAIYVHENLLALHKTGQAKFLESVILESRQYMAARVANRMRENNALANAMGL